jgi:hypothetical protein
MKTEEVKEYLENFDKRLQSPIFKQFAWKKAICRIILNDFENAKIELNKSLVSMLNSPMIWKKAGKPDLLAEIFILSGEKNFRELIISILKDYKLNDKWGDSNSAHRAYGLIGVMVPELNWEIHSSSVLISNEVNKRDFYFGKCIIAIIEKNSTLFENSLKNILDEHRQVATHGSLRATPEGWLCLPAMTLGILANFSGVKTNIDNKYFSQSYIKKVVSEM